MLVNKKYGGTITLSYITIIVFIWSVTSVPIKTRIIANWDNHYLISLIMQSCSEIIMVQSSSIGRFLFWMVAENCALVISNLLSITTPSTSTGNTPS